MPRFTRRHLLGATTVGASAAVLSACGGGDGSGAGGDKDYLKKEGKNFGGSLTWAAWANPGEAKRFNEYSQHFKKEYKTTVKFQVVSGDYTSKLMTQLAGNAAPDCFYVSDILMAKLHEAKQILEVGEYLQSDISRAPFKDFYTNLMDWCQPGEKGKYYGLPVDCNPSTFWFNKDMLTAAGFNEDPAALFEAGQWTKEACDELFTKVTATGKRAHVLEAGYAQWLSWMTTFGGKPFADDGTCQIDQDDTCVKVAEWMWQHLDAGRMVYGGTLPKGQGVDALFYAQQLATIPYGRWILPNLKELKFAYDIAPYPSESGKDIMPTLVHIAAMGVNAKAKDPDLGKAFMAIYCGTEGEGFRLRGGGNAVPAVRGLEDIVTEDDPPLPPHADTFNKIIEKGYAVPLKISTNAEVIINLATEVDKWMKAKVSAVEFCKKATRYINTGKA